MNESASKPLLGVYGLSFRYGSAPILSEVSFEIEAGTIVCLLGPNGCGKSTLLKLIAGVLPLPPNHSGGQIRYQGGIDLLRVSPLERARSVAYVGAHLRADFPITAYEAVLLGRICHASPGTLRTFRPHDGEEVRRAMERCLCWNLRERELATLSGGERQLVAMARALAQGARVLLLDEALSQMDLNHQALIGKLLKSLAAESRAIILVSHDLNLASEWATEAILLKGGTRLAAGPIAEVITEERIRAVYPGAELMVGKHPLSGVPKVFFKPLS